VNKTATSAESAFCFMIIHIQLQAPSCARTNKDFIADLTSWYNSTFGF